MDITHILHQILTVRYAELGSTVIIVYDHIITLDQEIELVWKAGWSLGKILFLLNRYYCLLTFIFNNSILFATHLTDNVCLHWFRWQGSTGLVAFVFGELILQLRLYAMYLLNRRVLFFMAIAFISSVAASATLMGILLHNVVARANLIPGVPFCIPQNLPKNYYAFWIPMLASETILCVLAMWRGVESYYQKRNLFQSGQSLISLLIRDSLAYFLVLFAVYLINTVIFITGTTTQLESAVGYLVAMSCVMSNRMCLNVRGMVREDDDEDSSSPPLQFSRNNSARRRGRAGLITIGTGDSAVVLTEFEMDELRGLRVKR